MVGREWQLPPVPTDHCAFSSWMAYLFPSSTHHCTLKMLTYLSRLKLSHAPLSSSSLYCSKQHSNDLTFGGPCLFACRPTKHQATLRRGSCIFFISFPVEGHRVRHQSAKAWWEKKWVNALILTLVSGVPAQMPYPALPAYPNLTQLWY
jgi:hypothetical protein